MYISKGIYTRIIAQAGQTKGAVAPVHEPSTQDVLTTTNHKKRIDAYVLKTQSINSRDPSI